MCFKFQSAMVAAKKSGIVEFKRCWFQRRLNCHSLEQRKPSFVLTLQFRCVTQGLEFFPQPVTIPPGQLTSKTLSFRFPMGHGMSFGAALVTFHFGRENTTRV